MCFFRKLFQKQPVAVPPIPSWEEIVRVMHDKQLDTGDVVDVIYSKDNAMRYVVLKDDKGLLTYSLEKLYPHDQDEWAYIALEKDALPAMWMPFIGADRRSVFSDMQDLEKELQAEPEYKQYF